VLYCAVCSRRYSYLVATGKNGRRYPYSYCLGTRPAGRGGCQEPHIPADRLEDQVERLYQRIQLPHHWLTELHAALEAEIAGRFATNCAATYRHADPRTRKLFKSAVIDRIEVRDGRITHVDYKAPFDLLFGGSGFVYRTVVELRGFAPLTPCMPSRDPHHGGHHATLCSRPLQESRRAGAWWFVRAHVAELLRHCCAVTPQLGPSSTLTSIGRGSNWRASL
jgi:hypothetical protein